MHDSAWDIDDVAFHIHDDLLSLLRLIMDKRLVATTMGRIELVHTATHHDLYNPSCATG